MTPFQYLLMAHRGSTILHMRLVKESTACQQLHNPAATPSSIRRYFLQQKGSLLLNTILDFGRISGNITPNVLPLSIRRG